MTVPTGAASFSDIQTEFGGSNPISLNEYYTGGGLTKSNIGSFAPNGIPSSGTISVNDFRGAQNVGETHSFVITRGTGSLFSTNYYGFNAFATGSSATNRPMTQGTNAPNFVISNANFQRSTPKGQASPITDSYSFGANAATGTTPAVSNADTATFKTLTDGSMTLNRSDATFGLTGTTSAASSFLYTFPSSSPGFSMNTASTGTSTVTLDCI